VTSYIPIGPTKARIKPIQIALKETDISFNQMTRPIDNNTWPYATAGFFKVKKKIPEILKRILT